LLTATSFIVYDTNIGQKWRPQSVASLPLFVSSVYLFFSSRRTRLVTRPHIRPTMNIMQTTPRMNDAR